MKLPFWIWILAGLSVISWIIPDGVPLIDEILLPVITIGSIILRRNMLKNFYQKQYRQYQSQSSGSKASGAGSGSGYQTGQSFYSKYRTWGQGFNQPQSQSGLNKDPYDVLGVKNGTSMDEIKKAYREKLKKFHPDVVANLKLAPEYKEMFEEKTREIQKAYKELGGK